MRSVWQDVRFALRQLRQSPGYPPIFAAIRFCLTRPSLKTYGCRRAASVDPILALRSE